MRQVTVIHYRVNGYLDTLMTLGFDAQMEKACFGSIERRIVALIDALLVEAVTAELPGNG